MKWRLLSGLIALLPFFATAQTYDELNKEFQKYYSKADYEKSIQLGEKTIEAAKRENKTGDSSYIILVNNLGGAYFLSAQYVKAEPLLILTKEIVKEKFGEKNNNYPAVLSTLGAMYEKMGKYEKAESSILEGMKILREVSGSESQAYWSCLSNLSNLYVTIGQYEKGETYVLQALEIIKKMQGENSPDYSTNIANLAYLYKTTGQYEKAEPLYIKAAELKKTLHGETHQNYVQVLNNLGTMYSSMGQYKKAEPLLNQALEIRYKIFGENSPFYATSLNNLAILYEAMGEYEKAEPLYSKCLAIRKQTLGEGHPDYAQILNNIAIFYIRWGKLSKAEPMLLSATEIIIQNLKKVFSILSEKEKTNYLSNNIRQTGLINSLQYKYTKASPAMSLLNFNLQLFFKTLSLTYTRNMLETVNSSSDSSILNTVKEWQLNKRTLARQYALPANKRVAQLDSIEAKTESLEKELTRKSADFRYQQSLTEISIKEVQKNLAADEVAVEFFRFRLITNSKTDSTRYAAYILQKQDSTPVFVPLFEERQLLQLLSNAGKTATSTAKMFYRGMEIKDRNTPSGRELYQLIWQPLEPYLKGIKKISYSPAGKLYSIAFHALPIDSATLLMDKYNLQQYVSRRAIHQPARTGAVHGPGPSLAGSCADLCEGKSVIR